MGSDNLLVPGVLSLVLAAIGCGSNASQQGGAGGSQAAEAGGSPSAGTGGSPSAAAGASSGGAAQTGGSGGMGPDLCPENPSLHQPGQTAFELAFTPVLAGKPLLDGEPNILPGGQLVPMNVRFYVSELSLVKGDGSLVAVDLVTPLGTPEPYGIHLVNFEEAESTKIHVAAPAGTYTGARFTFGINDACNAGGPSRKPPLSVASEMSWPHVAGFLFLRYEAKWTADAGATQAAPPELIHMGGVVGSVAAPTANVTGSLTVTAGASTPRTIQVSFDEIFRAASSTEAVSDIPIPTPEVIAGERLRRHVPELAIFKFAEP